MNNLITNFLCGGHSGDFIHELYAIKQLCKKHNTKANIYITQNLKEKFSFDINKIYLDFFKLVKNQSYVKNFYILDDNLNIEINYNMDLWREKEGDKKSWSVLLSEVYNFEIPKTYSWIEINQKDEKLKDSLLVHRSLIRKTHSFDWNKILSSKNKIYFLTTSEDNREYNEFKNNFNCSNVEPYIALNLWDMAIAINSCKLFIGNQSMPFALASSIDAPRICELNYGNDGSFYESETCHSKNISFEPKEELLN